MPGGSNVGDLCRDIAEAVARRYPGTDPSAYRVVLEWGDGGWLAFARAQYSPTRLYPVSHPTPEGALARLWDHYRTRAVR